MPIKLSIEKLSVPLKEPFAIAYDVMYAAELLRVTLQTGDKIGRGEACGVDYFGETADTMEAQIEQVRHVIEAGCSIEALQDLLPAGGARNAVDCAYWDLMAKTQNKSIWDLTGIIPAPTFSVYTISLETPAVMKSKALQSMGFANIKVKLDATDPVAKVRAVREARPDAKLIVDVNQGWNLEELKDYTPAMQALGVEMIEQPLPRGADEALIDYHSPVPLGADESCQTCADFEYVSLRYQVINIKLDKTGGLTEALKLRTAIESSDLSLMVGCMNGTSLSMAPGYVIAQGCDFVDLDGPLFLTEEHLDHPIQYQAGGGIEQPVSELWG